MHFEILELDLIHQQVSVNDIEFCWKFEGQGE